MDLKEVFSMHKNLFLSVIMVDLNSMSEFYYIVQLTLLMDWLNPRIFIWESLRFCYVQFILLMNDLLLPWNWILVVVCHRQLDTSLTKKRQKTRWNYMFRCHVINDLWYVNPSTFFFKMNMFSSTPKQLTFK